MVHYFLYELGPKEDLGVFLEAHVPGDWNTDWKGKVGAQGWMSVRAAITAIKQNDTLSDILRSSVSFGGDGDTVFAIAMGAASMCTRIERNIPAVLADGLEDGPFGRRFIEGVDRALLEKHLEIKGRL